MSELSEAMWNIRHELGRSMMDSMPEHAYITSTLGVRTPLDDAVTTPLIWPMFDALRMELDL
jgi:hypothetical protein